MSKIEFAPRVRSSVRHYHRDSYLGGDIQLNPNYPLIDCALGYSPWGMSPRAKEALRTFDSFEKIAAYSSDPFHERSLKPLLVERFADAQLHPSQIFFGHGSFNLAERLIHKMIVPDKMLGVGPQFNEIPSEFVAAGGTYNPIGLSAAANWEFPYQEMLQELRTGSYSMLYLDNPNNPLGYLLCPATDLVEILEEAERQGVVVLFDEAYGDFAEDRFSAATLVNQFSNIAVIRSFSKALGLAAERVGYLFLSEELSHIYCQLDVPFEPTILAAMLARETLNDNDFIAAIRRESRFSKEASSTILVRAGFDILPTDPSTSILTVHQANQNLPAKFASVGISVEPGSAFQVTHPGWDNSFCRIRVAPRELIPEFQFRLSSIR